MLGPSLSAQAVTEGTLVLPMALQAQQRPDIGITAPAGLGYDAVTLRTAVPAQRQRPFLLVCMSPASLWLSCQAKQVHAHDCGSRAILNDTGALPLSCQVVSESAHVGHCGLGYEEEWVLPFREPSARGLSKQHALALYFLD